LSSDASGSGFGAVLHQGDGAFAFFSRQIALCHAKLVAYERELIGLVQAVRHWHPYLWGCIFIIHIDHFSLKFLLNRRLSTIPQHQWASKLLGFDFQVKYKPSTTNAVANVLSWHDTGAGRSVCTLGTFIQALGRTEGRSHLGPDGGDPFARDPGWITR
jgi:hypothetical protein